LAEAQDIPRRFLHGILLDLCRAGLLTSHRGSEGGYVLTRPAERITVGDVLRAVNGSLSTVRGLPTEEVSYHGVATRLPELWQGVHAAIADVVDNTTLTDLLPPRWRQGG
jgi:Rrf2 family protein